MASELKRTELGVKHLTISNYGILHIYCTITNNMLIFIYIVTNLF